MADLRLRIADFAGTELEPVLRALDGEAADGTVTVPDGILTAEEQQLDRVEPASGKTGRASLDQADYAHLLASADRRGLSRFSFEHFQMTLRVLPRSAADPAQQAAAVKGLAKATQVAIARLDTKDYQSYPSLAEVVETLRQVWRGIALQPEERAIVRPLGRAMERQLGPHADRQVADLLLARMVAATEAHHPVEALEWANTALEFMTAHRATFYQAGALRAQVRVVLTANQAVPVVAQLPTYRDLRAFCRGDARLHDALPEVMTALAQAASNATMPYDERRELLLALVDFYLADPAPSSEALASQSLAQYVLLTKGTVDAGAGTPRALLLELRMLRRTAVMPAALYHWLDAVAALRAHRPGDVPEELSVGVQDTLLALAAAQKGAFITWGPRIQRIAARIFAQDFFGEAAGRQAALKRTHVTNDAWLKSFFQSRRLQLEVLVARGKIATGTLAGSDLQHLFALAQQAVPTELLWVRLDLYAVAFNQAEGNRPLREKIYHQCAALVRGLSPGVIAKEPVLLTAFFQLASMATALGLEQAAASAVAKAAQHYSRTVTPATESALTKAGWPETAIAAALHQSEQGEQVSIDDGPTYIWLAGRGGSAPSRAELTEDIGERLIRQYEQTDIGVPVFGKDAWLLLAPTVSYAQLVALAELVRSPLSSDAARVLDALRAREIDSVWGEAEEGGLVTLETYGPRWTHYASESHGDRRSFTPSAEMEGARHAAVFSFHTHESQPGSAATASKGDHVTNLAWQRMGLIVTRHLATQTLSVHVALPQGFALTLLRAPYHPPAPPVIQDADDRATEAVRVEKIGF